MKTNFLTSLFSSENPFNTLKHLASYKPLPNQNKVAICALKTIEIIARIFAELARGIAIAVIGTALILGGAVSLPAWGAFFIFNAIASKGPMQKHTMGTENLSLTQDSFEKHCNALIKNKRHVKQLTVHCNSAVPFALSEKNLELFRKMLDVVVPEQVQIKNCAIEDTALEALNAKHDLKITKNENNDITLKKVHRHDMIINIEDPEGCTKAIELFKAKDYRIKNLFVENSKEEAVEMTEELAAALQEFKPATIHLNNCKLPLSWHSKATQSSKISLQISSAA